MQCRFELLLESGTFSVRLTVDDGSELVAPFRFDLSPDSRIAHVISMIDRGGCQLDDLQDVGSELWAALCPPELKPLFQHARDATPGVLGIALDIPLHRQVDALPWEAMYDVRGGRFLCSDPDVALYRVPARDTPRAAAPRQRDGGALKLLALVPSRSGLQVPYEWSALRGLEQHGVAMEPLDGTVTVERLAGVLRAHSFDILHYIGHGDFDERGVSIRLNDTQSVDRETWLDANRFAALFAAEGVQLAVMNCCLSAPSVSRRLAGLGPQLTRTARIPAVVAMRYEIDDTIAIQFADTFYTELFAGNHPGRVDLAMQAARLTLMSVARTDTIRGFITPILYLAPGREQLFPAAVRTPATPPTPRTAMTRSGRPSMDLPPKLISAFRGARCIPVVGSGIHAFDQVRREAAAPTLGEIVGELASAWLYPESEELQFAERCGEGFVSLILPRVFQHFEQTRERAEIIAAIRKICNARRTSPLLDRIAAWNVPGIVYTHIDGLMLTALRSRPDTRVINIIESDQEAQAITSALGRHAAPAPDREPLLLINLRGSLNDPGSLVLTESDHEMLEDRLRAKGGEVGALLKGNSTGRTLLFLGVHPRDPVVRRLCKTHLVDARRVQRFFVSAHPSAVDEAYWHDLDVQWVYADPAAVVEALAEMVDGDES